MSDSTVNSQPLLKKRFRVVVDVEITVHDVPETVEETQVPGKTSYAAEVAPWLRAERNLLHALLRRPDDLQRYLAMLAVVRVDLCQHPELEELALGHETDDTEFLAPVAETLSEPDQSCFIGGDVWDFETIEAFRDAFEVEITATRVEEIE